MDFCTFWLKQLGNSIHFFFIYHQCTCQHNNFQSQITSTFDVGTTGSVFYRGKQQKQQQVCGNIYSSFNYDMSISFFNYLKHHKLTLYFSVNYTYMQRVFHFHAPNQSRITRSEAFFFAGGVVFCSALSVLVTHPLLMGCMHIGMKVRVATCSAIYRKVCALIMVMHTFPSAIILNYFLCSKS